MKYLLDTHILIWALSDRSYLLPDNILSEINKRDNEIFYSVASVWETTIKYSIKPEQIGVSPDTLVNLCNKADMKCLPITCEHALNVQTLKRLENAPQHKDPFDRLLIAQAKYEGMVLITHDSLFAEYNEECILKI